MAEYKKIFLEDSERSEFLPVEFSSEQQNFLHIESKGVELVEVAPRNNYQVQEQKRKRPSTRLSRTKIEDNKGVNSRQNAVNAVFLDGIQQLLNLQHIVIHQNISQLNTIQPHNQCIKKLHFNSFSRVFQPSYAKREQKSNKNFVKFLLPKLYLKFEEIKNQNPEWYQFNKQIEAQHERNSTINALRQLFQGNDESNFKRINREIVREMLHDRKFYSDYFFGTRYIQKRKNKKQYLLAAKIFSLRCISSHLMGRVQTK